MGRLGGEEFVVCMAASSTKEIARICEEIRSAVSKLTVPGTNHALSVSGGVATTDETANAVGGDETGDGMSELDTLIEHADQRLYQAKGTGRNRIVSS